MQAYLIPIQPFLIVFLKHAVNQIFQSRRHPHWKFDRLMQYLRLQLLDSHRMEGRPPRLQLVNDNPERPYVHLVGIVLLLEDLRSDVERRALDRLQEIGGCRHLLGEAEVAQLDGSALQQDVLGFEVAMDHLILMEVQHRRQNLPPVVPHPLLTEPPLLEQPRQVVSGVLHNNHHFFRCLEGLLHGDDILVFQFGQQLRLLR